MHNTAGGSLHRRVHNSIKSSTLGGGAAGCGRRRQEVTYLLHCRDHVILFYRLLVSPLITSNSLFIFVSVFNVCVTTFSPGYFYFYFLFLHLLHVRRVINPPPYSRGIQGGFPAVLNAGLLLANMVPILLICLLRHFLFSVSLLAFLCVVNWSLVWLEEEMCRMFSVLFFKKKAVGIRSCIHTWINLHLHTNYFPFTLCSHRGPDFRSPCSTMLLSCLLVPQKLLLHTYGVKSRDVSMVIYRCKIRNFLFQLPFFKPQTQHIIQKG